MTTMTSSKIKIAGTSMVIVPALYFAGCASVPQEASISKIRKERAVELVSHLNYGMTEANALDFLKRDGLEPVGQAGDSFSWGDFYNLQNHCTLSIVFSPKQISPDGAWINGLLREASIREKDGTIEPISLTQGK
ncbi:MAG TPA: hypothetical protein VH280_17135 [Verrucomicrobiae bacterium]|jgi:hypothetical protein|nr:hypothetical protein [Verrucomicrobiae bacterium]